MSMRLLVAINIASKSLQRGRRSANLFMCGCTINLHYCCFQEADRLDRERVAREEREKRLAEEALERQLRPRRRKARQSRQHEELTQPTLLEKIKARLGTILIVFIVILMMLSLAVGLGLFRK